MTRKKYCQLTSIIIPEVWFIPGGKGAPPGRHHGRFGHAVRLPTRSRVFVDHLPRCPFLFLCFSFHGVPSLLKGKRVGEPPPWVVFVAAIMAFGKLWNSLI
jgi:hypothetical protein